MDYSLEECIRQEKFTIRQLELENSSCEGCRIEAIKYHKAVLFYLETLEEKWKDTKDAK